MDRLSRNARKLNRRLISEILLARRQELGRIFLRLQTCGLRPREAALFFDCSPTTLRLSARGLVLSDLERMQSQAIRRAFKRRAAKERLDKLARCHPPSFGAVPKSSAPGD